MDADGVLRLKSALTAYLHEFDDCMGVASNRRHLATYVQGQLGPGDRKSVEPIADRAGVPARTLQEFLEMFKWDHQRLRDRHQRRVAKRHGTVDSIGLFDETSYPKKGRETAGVQRQHCGALGKLENCVVSVHLGFATPDYYTLLDGDLYMPRETWIDDSKRRTKAGVPDELTFRTKPQIALDLWRRARGNGVFLSWLVFDEGYGNNPPFLLELDRGGQKFVGEVPRNFLLWTREPRRRGREHACDAAGIKPGPRFMVQTLPRPTVENILTYSPIAREVPWELYRVMDATTGPMVWEIKRLPVWIAREDGTPTTRPWTVLLARSVNQKEEIKYFVSNAPEGTRTQDIAFVAFSRWRVERLFEDAKTDLGLDHFEVRKYQSVIRHLIITCLSHAFLAEVKQRELPKSPGDDGESAAGHHQHAGTAVGAESSLFTPAG